MCHLKLPGIEKFEYLMNAFICDLMSYLFEIFAHNSKSGVKPHIENLIFSAKLSAGRKKLNRTY